VKRKEWKEKECQKRGRMSTSSSIHRGVEKFITFYPFREGRVQAHDFLEAESLKDKDRYDER